MAYEILIQRLRVPIGFISAILFVIISRPTWRSLAIGAPIALAGALIRAWASGHLRKNAELAVSGPYAFTRNPLYFGSFVMAAGCPVRCGGLWRQFWAGVVADGILPGGLPAGDAGRGRAYAEALRRRL